MMRDYHVPVGLTKDEKEKLEVYFSKKNKEDVKWY